MSDRKTAQLYRMVMEDHLCLWFEIEAFTGK